MTDAGCPNLGPHKNQISQSPDLPLPHGLSPSETMVWDHGLNPPLSTENPWTKGFSGSEAPIFGFGIADPHPRGRGRPLLAENRQVVICGGMVIPKQLKGACNHFSTPNMTGEGSTVQWKGSPPSPGGLKPFCFRAPTKRSTKQGDARGASEVRRRTWTSSNHFHCPAPQSSSHIGHGILAFRPFAAYFFCWNNTFGLLWGGGRKWRRLRLKDKRKFCSSCTFSCAILGHFKIEQGGIFFAKMQATNL